MAILPRGVTLELRRCVRGPVKYGTPTILLIAYL